MYSILTDKKNLSPIVRRARAASLAALWFKILTPWNTTGQPRQPTTTQIQIRLLLMFCSRWLLKKNINISAARVEIVLPPPHITKCTFVIISPRIEWTVKTFAKWTQQRINLPLESLYLLMRTALKFVTYLRSKRTEQQTAGWYTVTHLNRY